MRSPKCIALILFLVSLGQSSAAIIPPHYLDAVISLGYNVVESVPSGGSRYVTRYIPVGTGFIYSYHIRKYRSSEGKELSEDAIRLVTNKHVYMAIAEKAAGAVGKLQAISPSGGPKLQPALTVRISFTDAGGARKIDEFQIPISSPHWNLHPTEDLAMIGVEGPEIARVSRIKGEDAFRSVTQAKDIGLHEGSEVFALGFPGLVGEHRDFVVVRKGVIARIRDAIAGQSNSLLVDAFIFPGNSGGPVVLKPEFISIGQTKAIDRSYFLGVVSQFLAYQEFAISSQTGRPRVQFEENSGLAVVIPSWVLHEWIHETLPPDVKSRVQDQ